MLQCPWSLRHILHSSTPLPLPWGPLALNKLVLRTESRWGMFPSPFVWFSWDDPKLGVREHPKTVFSNNWEKLLCFQLSLQLYPHEILPWNTRISDSFSTKSEFSSFSSCLNNMSLNVYSESFLDCPYTVAYNKAPYWHSGLSLRYRVWQK